MATAGSIAILGIISLCGLYCILRAQKRSKKRKQSFRLRRPAAAAAGGRRSIATEAGVQVGEGGDGKLESFFTEDLHHGDSEGGDVNAFTKDLLYNRHPSIKGADTSEQPFIAERKARGESRQLALNSQTYTPIPTKVVSLSPEKKN